MGFSISKWFRGTYTEAVLNETLDNSIVRALASSLYRGFGHANFPDGNNRIPPTTAEGSTSPNSTRNYGRLPSQGDWFSPPPQYPGKQSTKL